MFFLDLGISKLFINVYVHMFCYMLKNGSNYSFANVTTKHVLMHINVIYTSYESYMFATCISVSICAAVNVYA